MQYNYYQDKEGYERDKIVHHEVIRLLKEKVVSLEAQSELSREAINAWKERKKSEAGNHPEEFIVEESRK